jgi:hypothetical protein
MAALYFEIPAVAATKSSGWAMEKLEDAVIAPVMTRLAELAQAGLTGTTVVRKFLSWRIAPFQEHRRKIWAFTGFKHTMWLSSYGLDKAALEASLNMLLGESEIPEPS